MFLRHRRWIAVASLALVSGWVVVAGAQKPGTSLPLDPLRERGTSISPAFEGW